MLIMIYRPNQTSKRFKVLFFFFFFSFGEVTEIHSAANKLYKKPANTADSEASALKYLLQMRAVPKFQS